MPTAALGLPKEFHLHVECIIFGCLEIPSVLFLANTPQDIAPHLDEAILKVYH